MRKNGTIVLALAIVILFFIQLAGTLIESIYILDLMNTTLDEKVLGLLFFFAPILLTPLYKKRSQILIWFSFVVLFIAREIMPYLKTEQQLIAAGVGVFAEIEVGGYRFTIYNVHPAGSDTAMLAFAETLVERSKDQPHVIALGDYNLRDDNEAYQMIDAVYTNAWTSVYPSKISDDGVDMSGRNRIDHIFVSPELGVRDPIYVLPPESATDHPAHWADIYWDTP